MRIRQIFAKDAIRHDHAPRAEHLFALTEDGRIFERFSDDDPGKWSEVPGPAKRQQQQAGRTRKK